MNEYTIYCTKEQTKKALELGAPIIKATYQNKEPHVGVLVKLINKETIYDYICPTAEQMIGWLEEHGILISITALNTLDNPIYNYNINRGEESWSTFSSRKEATLAAIDAALEYLDKNKKTNYENNTGNVR